MPGLLALLLSLPLAATAATPIPLVDKGMSTYYVPVDIEGAGTLDFLVDTGSSYSVIGATTLKRLRAQGMAAYKRRVGGRMADGRRRYVPIYSIAELDIGGSCTLQNVEVAVLPGRTRAILGFNALRRTAPFVVSVDPPTLELTHCDGADATQTSDAQ